MALIRFSYAQSIQKRQSPVNLLQMYDGGYNASNGRRMSGVSTIAAAEGVIRRAVLFA